MPGCDVLGLNRAPSSGGAAESAGADDGEGAEPTSGATIAGQTGRRSAAGNRRSRRRFRLRPLMNTRRQPRWFRRATAFAHRASDVPTVAEAGSLLLAGGVGAPNGDSRNSLIR